MGVHWGTESPACQTDANNKVFKTAARVGHNPGTQVLQEKAAAARAPAGSRAFHPSLRAAASGAWGGASPWGREPVAPMPGP